MSHPSTSSAEARRSVSLSVVWGSGHYDTVVKAARAARTSLWIATANLKDVHVEAAIGTRARASGRYASLMEELGELANRGVEVRILHAGVPSGPLTQRLGRDTSASRVALRRCIRVHMKMIAVDGELLYLGSANFTGAGLGAKGEGRRNFEAGVLTSDEVLLDRMQGEFDAIWRGQRCKGCALRKECPRPLDLAVPAKSEAPQRRGITPARPRPAGGPDVAATRPSPRSRAPQR